MIGMTFSLFRDFIQYQKEIKERFKMINKSHMPSLATSLYTENLPQIKNIISGILSVQDMVYLEIKLDDDEEFSRTRQPKRAFTAAGNMVCF